MVRHESRPSQIRHITLDTKQTGAPSAGNLHAGCDAAGAGNGFTVRLLRHSPGKRGATEGMYLGKTTPVPDPPPIRSLTFAIRHHITSRRPAKPAKNTYRRKRC